jgi:hypothetical protein
MAFLAFTTSPNAVMLEEPFAVAGRQEGASGLDD